MSTFSLIIATLGRKRELVRLLESLIPQSVSLQVVLVDQNPPGYLSDILQPFLNKLPITQLNVPSKGVSVARNIGLTQATGDFIAFPDDDCWYAPDTLTCVLELFRANPSCGALLGVWTASPETPAHKITEGIVSRTDLFRLAGTCVQFYRKEAVAGIQFDPLLGPGTGLPYGCGEDTDYLLHVHALTEVRRYKKIRVFHPAPETNLPSSEKVASYAAGRIYLLKKHNFPLWFVFANILFPLAALPLGTLKHGRGWANYRWQMFKARLRAWSCG